MKPYPTPQFIVTVVDLEESLYGDFRQISFKEICKIPLIKLIRSLTGFNLKEAKDFVEGNLSARCDSQAEREMFIKTFQAAVRFWMDQKHYDRNSGDSL